MVDECGFSSTAIPTNKLNSFKNLKKIKVKGCESVERVFDLEGLSASDGQLDLLHQLRELHLFNLPKLTQICNKNHEGILDFRNLKLVKLENCGIMKYAFTQSMVLCLWKLEKVQVRSCEMMEGLIEAEEAAESDNKIVFPELKSVALEGLTNFLSFCSESGNLECPSLTEISIHDCPKMKMQPSFSMLDEGEDENPDKEKVSLFFPLLNPSKKNCNGF